MKKISKNDFEYLVHCAQNYDLFTQYIDSYRQMEQAQEANAAYSGDFDEIVMGLGISRPNICEFANCGEKTADKLEAWLNDNGVEVEAEEKPAKRIWTEEEIKNLIQTNDKVLYGALKMLYNEQTADEQDSGETKHNNGVGFNGADSRIMSSFAEFLLKTGFLTGKQKAIARKKLVKYNKQLTRLANA